jgi:hypothetical protein
LYKDQDGSGLIRYTEFLASTIEAQGAIDERRLAEAFDRLDSDDSGYITVENLKGILGDDFPDSEVEAILKECAKDGNVSYMDFLAQWNTQKETKRQDFLADISNLTYGSGHPLTQDLLLTYEASRTGMSPASVVKTESRGTEAAAVQHEGDHVFADV